MRETCACGASTESNWTSDLAAFRRDHQCGVQPTPLTQELRQTPRLVTVKGGHVSRRLRERVR